MEDASTQNTREVPRHVAIIMDGNGRWARSRGLPRNEGHRRGAENVIEVVKAAKACRVRMLTLFAFSVENWKRPESEVSALWRLLEYFIKHYLKELISNEVRLNIIGRKNELPDHILKQINRATEATAEFTEYQCNVALNYGSRTEAADAAAAFARDVKAGKANPEDMDWPLFSRYLYTAELPDPDLLIRTSGESRISNFLLLQCAYSELYFTPVYWPDFGRDAFVGAIDNYCNRERRFGLTGEQIREQELLAAAQGT